MKIEITETELVIRISRINPPTISKSGKSLLVATSSGIVKTDTRVDGKVLQVGVNAFVEK